MLCTAILPRGLNPKQLIRHPITMKSIITLTLAVAALTLAACASKHTNTPPPPVDMGHHSGK